MKLADFFVLRNTSITRGHNFKLYKPLCNLNVRKYSFAYRVIDLELCQVILFLNIRTFRSKLDSPDLSPFSTFTSPRQSCVNVY